ncbi:MAG TPA: ABC transporter permease [Pilimelia sp.]|nr:ABC transporter permease [Pilimelia sp.]
MTSGVVAVWSHRSVLRLLVQRDLTVKYQQSVLGYFWSLIEPLVMGLVYWFIFGVLYGGRAVPPGPSYAMFILSGIFAWMWASTAMSEATGALTGQARLITTMKVPREVFPIGRVLARFAEYLAGLPILALAAVLLDADFTWYLLTIPLAVLLQGALLVGLSLLLSSWNVLLRDVERFVRLAQRVLFYAAPIIYPLALVQDSDLPHWVKVAYEVNPLTGVFQLHHAAWYPSELDWSLTAVSAVGCLAVLLVGWSVFRRLEPAVLKEL